MKRLLWPVVGILVIGVIVSTSPAQTGKKKSAPAKKAIPPAVVPKSEAGPQPFALDPLNPRVFRFRAKTVILTGATESYGAVQNTAFDFRKYLDALAEDHLNVVRVITGTYVESDDLATYLAPWVQSAPGKFDLEQFEPKYFDRLKTFVSEAGLRNIVVDVTLFSTMYGSGKGYGAWAQSPLNFGKLNWDRFNTMDDAALLAVQDALVQKTAMVLNGLDNFYFTVCNECKYSGATAKETKAWMEHIHSTLRETEAKLPNKHLVSDSSSIFRAPGIHAPVCNAAEIRKDAWTWMFTSGGSYTALDPSFSRQTPDGPACKEARIQLGVLQTFLQQFDLAVLKPDPDAVRQWALGASTAWTLSDPGRTYALYLRNPAIGTLKSVLLMDLPAGKWQMEWLNPRTGDLDKPEAIHHKGGTLRILTPGYTDDLALRLTLVTDATPVPLAEPVRKQL